MSNFERTRRMKEEEEKWNKERSKILAAFFFDISKLFMGGWVIGAAMPIFSSAYNKDIWLVVLLGVCASIISALIGNTILK